MATINVKDSAGSTVAIEKPNANGRAAATSSRPVVLSTEDKASLDAITAAFSAATFFPATQPISAAALPLPAGAATSAKQDDLIAAIGAISPGGSGGGDASAANQDEQTALLTSIDATLGAATYYPATQPVSGNVGITGSVAVTGPLTDTQLRATPVPVSGTFWPTTQPISGNVGITGSVAVTGPLTDTQLRATAVPVSGTFWQATQPVSLATAPALVAGSAIIGKVGIDQTTDGTTNKVNIDASLKSGTATRTSVASSTTSATILASNAVRKGATIFNSDANALLLDLSGGTAAATRCQVRLTQYQSYEVGSGFTGAITGIWEADGSGIADVVEFT